MKPTEVSLQYSSRAEEYSLFSSVFSLYESSQKGSPSVEYQGAIRTAFENVVSSNCSCMTVSSVSSLPDKGLKVVVENERIIKIGTGYFVNAYAAQPLYKILKKQWKKWLDGIIEFCESGKTECYAEKAFNKLSDICYIMTLDIGNRL